MRTRRTRRLTAVCIAAVLMVLAMTTGCQLQPDTKAVPTSDTFHCVYEGDRDAGQKLNYQLQPGDKSVVIGDNDQDVVIPASNRFYMAAKDDNLRDPLAPQFYLGNAKGSVPVEVEGQLLMKFNPSKPCDWYSKFGRRNLNGLADLGFNLRGTDAANAGWFHFLAENFGLTMTGVTRNLADYSWPALWGNYPVNANETGTVPADQTAGEGTLDKLGRDLGQRFTVALKAFLGDDYFCGTETGTDQGDCPPITFQVLKVEPQNKDLIKSRQEVETTRQQLESTKLAGELQQQQQAAVVAAETAKQVILQEQAKTALAQAQVDNAKCLVLATAGLDCEGHFPTQSGVNITPSK